MFERSESDGRPDRSARLSASLSRPIAVWTLFSWNRQTPSVKKTSARSTSEKLAALDEPARLVQQLERDAERTESHLRAAGTDERAYLELGKAARVRRRHEHVVLLRGLFVGANLEQRLGAREGALEAAALVGGDAVRKESRVDAEADGEPVDRLARRPRLAALDLRDVLLREPLAGELALGQARGDPQLTQAFAEAQPDRGGDGGGGTEGGGSSHTAGRAK